MISLLTTGVTGFHTQRGGGLKSEKGKKVYKKNTMEIQPFFRRL